MEICDSTRTVTRVPGGKSETEDGVWKGGPPAVPGSLLGAGSAFASPEFPAAALDPEFPFAALSSKGSLR
jgi:hypothetical protein